MKELIQKANILIEALPYIQKLAGKTVVVKYGGNAMVNDTLKNSVMEDVTLLKYIGVNPVVVHGGGPDISSILKDLNIQSNFINGLRVTDDETMKVVQMVLIGKTNKEIVSLLNLKGGKAIGFSGIDGGIIKCKKQTTKVNDVDTDIGFVGEIIDIDSKAIEMICKDEYIPVIAPVGVDENGQSYNINADTAASHIAAALKAEKLIFLTDVEGVKDSRNNNTVVSAMSKDMVDDFIKNKIIVGGMIPKVLGCLKALEMGVKRTHIIDGTIEHCILLEIFTDKGIGTMISFDGKI